MSTLFVGDDFRVINEEIVIHASVEETPSGNLSGEARIIGEIEVGGKTYSFNRVIKVTFKEDE